MSFLKKSNGFYSIINIEGDVGWIAVDRIRSLPLFYGQHNGKFFISDDARWVREQVHDNEMDPIAREEFLTCGYVTGPDTLFPNVKQVQAGEVIFFQIDNDGEIAIEPHRYFRYYPSNFFSEPPELLHEKLDMISTNVFQRLIEYANGRTLVVPLSGGYDSRHIVLMLKRMGYKNVLAFSYGKPGNREAEISEAVAKSLGIPWEFVPYSNEKWYEWYRSPEMERYFMYADGLASLPHVQDWPAVWSFKKDKRIPNDAIFVPGHTPMLAIQINAVERIWNRTKGEQCFFKMLREAHYNLREQKDSLIHCTRNIWYSKQFDMTSKEKVAAIGDFWAWTERQSKFICNSVRVYEFFGFDWWLPLWDLEFVSFCERIPYECRLGKSFYKKYVDRISEQQDLSLQDLQMSTGKGISIKKAIMGITEKALPKQCLKILPDAVFKYHIINHPSGSLGRFPQEDVIKLLRQGCSSNGIAAYFCIKRLEENLYKGEI